MARTCPADNGAATKDHGSKKPGLRGPDGLLQRQAIRPAAMTLLFDPAPRRHPPGKMPVRLPATATRPAPGAPGPESTVIPTGGMAATHAPTLRT